MFLYELALELDVKSGELVDLAEQLGMGTLMASSTITREQVAMIRAAKAGQPLPPAAPAPAGATGVAGPALWADPAAPPPPPPPPPPGGMGTPPPGMPQFEAPAPVGQAWQPGAAPVAPGMPGMPGMAGMPGVPPLGDGEPAMGRNQKVIIGAVAVLAVVLFGFMALNSGPDKEREAKLRAENAADDARPLPTLPPTTSTSTTTTAPSDYEPGKAGPTRSHDYTYVDRFKFCQGARGITAFELRFGAAITERDWGGIQQTVADGKAKWQTAVDLALAGASPALRPDVETYRTTYMELIRRIEVGTSEQAFIDAVRDLYTEQLEWAANKINQSTVKSCI